MRRGIAVRGGSEAPSRWNLPELAGRLIEISGCGATAALTAAAALIHECQRRGELAVWITAGPSTFHPPDLAQCGIDLAALPVVRAAGAIPAARAADVLLRSGALGLIVIDLDARDERQQRVPIAIQSRLAGLAQKHGTAVLFLTRKERDAASLGSLVSVRVQCTRERTAFDRFAWELCFVKDKRRGPGGRHVEVCRGPVGLC